MPWQKFKKPGVISNVVAVPHVGQLENFEQLVINALLTVFPYLRYPKQVKISLEESKVHE